MKELGEKIVSYWGNRAEGYSEYNREELAGDKWQDWITEIKKQLPKKEKSEIRILDIGTGPGFFAILLAQEGNSNRLYRRNAGRSAGKCRSTGSADHMEVDGCTETGICGRKF